MNNSLSVWNNGLFTRKHALSEWGDFSDFYRAVEDAYKPRCDVTEDEKGYTFHFDLPGVDKEQISVELKENVLSVQGKREAVKKDETSTALYSERASGQFFRSFEIPTKVDADKIEAIHKDGVLTVKIPKAESAKPKQIRVA